MAITKLSSQDFNQDTSRAKRAAKRVPFSSRIEVVRPRAAHGGGVSKDHWREKDIMDLFAMRKPLGLKSNRPVCGETCTSRRT